MKKMAEGILMPKAGITVEECIITRWSKKVGDSIKVGDILFSYETDKASFECESTAEGELLEIFFDDGAQVPVLVNVCAVGKKGEDVSALRPGEKAATASQSDKKKIDASVAISETPAEAPVNTDGKLKISPRAKALAEKNGVNASLASPSGPYGRVVENDIRNLLSMGVRNEENVTVSAPLTAKTTDTAPVAAPVINGEYEDVKLTKIRQVIAKSMSLSLSSVPQLTHHHTFDMTNILEFRKSVKERAEQLGIPKITINDIILYAVSRTLPLFPDFNANFTDNTVRRFKDVNLGVAADTPRGLMVPTIFGASALSLTEISAQAKKLIKSAQEGSINPDLLQGGTFTVTNLGSLGVEMFTPVINAPQTAILGVCSVTTRFKMVNGAAVPYQAMGLSLTYDHRVIDGAPAAKFMQALIANLENFTAMLV